MSALSLQDRDDIVSVVTTYHTIVKVKAEVDQFLDGLQSLGVHDYIKSHPDLMKPLFVADNITQLTSGKSLYCTYVLCNLSYYTYNLFTF